MAKAEIPSEYTQSEKLLPAIDAILRKNKIKLDDIKKIKVANIGGGFTALRIGILTANALGYALGIPVSTESDKTASKKGNKSSFDIVKPIYDKEPNITV